MGTAHEQLADILEKKLVDIIGECLIVRCA